MNIILLWIFAIIGMLTCLAIVVVFLFVLFGSSQGKRHSPYGRLSYMGEIAREQQGCHIEY